MTIVMVNCLLSNETAYSFNEFITIKILSSIKQKFIKCFSSSGKCKSATLFKTLLAYTIIELFCIVKIYSFVGIILPIFNSFSNFASFEIFKLFKFL